jgi:hypothetical protein
MIASWPPSVFATGQVLAIGAPGEFGKKERSVGAGTEGVADPSPQGGLTMGQLNDQQANERTRRMLDAWARRLERDVAVPLMLIALTRDGKCVVEAQESMSVELMVETLEQAKRTVTCDPGRAASSNGSAG